MTKKKKINITSLESNFFPDYLIKSLNYDFKIFIAINRSVKKISYIYFGWCPDRHLPRPKLGCIFIILNKNLIYNNNTIYIHRIAQNPYYDNMLNVKSIDLVNRLEDIEYSNGEKFLNLIMINYMNMIIDFRISWDFYKN